MTQYKVKDLMVPNPEVISQNHSLKDAAMAMARIDCGIMPVGTPEKLVGMITDRDIALRAVAKGKDPAKTKISEIMTNNVYSVAEDTPLDQAAEIIKKQRVNRLVVKDSKGKLTGILSLTGLLREAADKHAVAEFVRQLAAKSQPKAA
jgi:CBS domain-containing protein